MFGGLNEGYLETELIEKKDDKTTEESNRSPSAYLQSHEPTVEWE